MADLKLVATPVLGRYSQRFGETSLQEVCDLAVVSIAVPLDGEARLGEAMRAAYGTEKPDVGMSTVSADSETRFLSLARDQFFALWSYDGADAAEVVAGKLGHAGYYTLQSDNWACLRLSGPDAIPALERLCMLDLHPSAFPIGKAARTSMEHLGVIIVKEKADMVLLMSAWSSAESFLHAIETSLRNVTNT